MEKGRPSQEKEANKMTRRAFFEKAGAVLGGAAATAGFGDLVINTGRLEDKEKEIIDRYKSLPRNVEIDRLREVLKDENVPSGRRDFAKKVLEEAEARNNELKEIGRVSSGTRKFIDGAAVLAGGIFASPYLFRRRHEILNK